MAIVFACSYTDKLIIMCKHCRRKGEQFKYIHIFQFLRINKRTC